MIKFENRYDEYAYRLANFDVDPAVTTLNEGQWVTIGAAGLAIADGTKKSFISTGSKRTGRDQISGKPVQKSAILHGTFVLSTDQFDTGGTYAEMTPLKVTTGGILTPWTTGTDKVELLVAYAVAAPTNGFLRIISA